MEYRINQFLKTTFFKRLILYSVIIFLLFRLRSFLNLFLMIFFVTYIMNELCKFLHKHLSKTIKISQISILIITYLTILLLFVVATVRYSPLIFEQGKEIVQTFDPSSDINAKINDKLSEFLSALNPYFGKVFSEYNFDPIQKLRQFSGSITDFSYSLLKNIGLWAFNIFLMFILSFFFLLEKNKMLKFVNIFKESKISFLYNELHSPCVRFYNVFGFMIKTQIIVSLINTLITVLIISLLGFKNLFALGLMVFILGLIPVAGAIMSTIPLLIIGLTIGGFAYVIYILLMILLIHCLEAYILSPKISSKYTKLPIFITLLVLLISEYLLGPWGLIFGLPIFVFIVDSMKITSEFSPPIKTESKNDSPQPSKSRAKS